MTKQKKKKYQWTIMIKLNYVHIRKERGLGKSKKKN
jgi:hypothetical protein